MLGDTPQLNQCPKCGRFVKDIWYTENGLHEIKEITGICAKHGKVSLYGNAWDWEQVHSGSEYECDEARRQKSLSMA